MKLTCLVVMSLALAAAVGLPPAHAQQPPAAAAPAIPQSMFSVLFGRWVRSDGVYVISIRGVDTGLKLDAGYENPAAVPFHSAEVKKDGDALKAFFELRDWGYNGSTYLLTYDAASDQLKGTYYQAVAKQRFEVVFVRAK